MIIIIILIITLDDNIKSEISDMEKLILQRQSYNTDFSFLS